MLHPRKSAIGLMAGCVLAAASVLSAQPERSRLDALVAGAAKSAEHRFTRAEGAVEKATKESRATARWFSLMNIARKHYRVAYSSLDRFKAAAISDEVKALQAKALLEATSRLVTIYEVLIEEYVATGSRTTAARLVGELERVDPKVAAALKAKLVKDDFGPRPQIGDVSLGPTYTPRTRAGRRLTGEEARYLGRRGYTPPGATNPGRSAPRPSVPAPATRPPATRPPSGPPAGGRR